MRLLKKLYNAWARAANEVFYGQPIEGWWKEKV